MTDTSTRERFRRNASGIAATAVTGTWLAALLLDFGWWLPLMLFGYIVIVPVVSMLFDEEESAWGGADRTAGRETDPESERDRERELSRHAGRDRSGDRDRDDVGRGDTTDALDRLRTRYANGDLTDEQFERKLDRLLETETPEDAAEYVERSRRSESESDRGVERER